LLGALFLNSLALELEPCVGEDDGLLCSLERKVSELYTYIDMLVDSGASISAAPAGCIAGVSSSSRYAGSLFRAANGTPIKPEASVAGLFECRAQDGVSDLGIHFEVCAVSKAILSVRELNRAGHSALFIPGRAHIKLSTGAILPLYECPKSGGFYLRTRQKKITTEAGTGF